MECCYNVLQALSLASLLSLETSTKTRQKQTHVNTRTTANEMIKKSESGRRNIFKNPILKKKNVKAVL